MKTIVSIHASMTHTGLANLTGRDIDRRDRLHGFSKCGYHFVISRDGATSQFRKEAEPSIHDNHTARESLSICLVGGTNGDGAPENNFTLPQWDSLKQLTRVLRQVHQQATLRCQTPAVSNEDVGRILEG